MKIDKQTADQIIAQLSGAMLVLEQAGPFGIRMVATKEAVAGLRQSTHPDTEHVIANLLVTDAIFIDGQRGFELLPNLMAEAEAAGRSTEFMVLDAPGINGMGSNSTAKLAAHIAAGGTMLHASRVS